MPTVELPGETSGVEPRVLLLLQRRNRELLGRWLGRDWTVLSEEGGVPDRFDVCVLDGASFSEHRERLAQLKTEARPEFLPYLMVVREGERPYLDRAVRESVDEVIVVPARPTEFTIRLRGLLRARWQSVTLREQKEREIAALARQNERLDQFASIVSHDLRNPLTVIGGSLDLALQTGELSQLDLAVEAVDRMEDLIEGLLELARQGRAVGETTPVDVETVARKGWSVVHSHGATLVVDDAGTVEADEERLHALFENLFRNAVGHGSTGDTEGSTAASPVTIRVGALPADTGFYVADDGPGIPPELRERVMEHGYTTDPQGTGFGLAIVRSIADAHDWTVRITDAESGGARFEFDCTPERG